MSTQVNRRRQGLIFEEMPTVPTPSTLTWEDDGFLPTDIVLGEECFLLEDNKYRLFYRDPSGIVEAARQDWTNAQFAALIDIMAEMQTDIDQKLNAADYNEHFKGKFTSLIQLTASVTDPVAGDYAQVDNGAGDGVKNYNFDVDDGWVLGSPGSSATNTDELPEGSTAFYFTEQRVRDTVATGLTEAATRTNISATDSVLAIFGKIKKWFTDLASVAFSGSYTDLSNKPDIPSGTNTLPNQSSVPGANTSNALNTVYSLIGDLETTRIPFNNIVQDLSEPSDVTVTSSKCVSDAITALSEEFTELVNAETLEVVRNRDNVIEGDINANNNTIRNLKNATNPQEPSTLTQLEAGVADAKAYADSLVTTVFRPAGDWDASVATYPTTGTGTAGAIRRGDLYKISVAGTIAGYTYDVGDSIYAIIAVPGQSAANWGDFEHNTQQATESIRGTTQVATNAESANENSTLDTKFVTPKKLWGNFWTRVLALNWTWALKQTFTTAPRFSSTTANQILEVDASRDLTSVAKGTAYNKDFGTLTTNVPEIGATLGNSQVVETNGSGKLISAAKNSGYNKNTGTTAGTVAAGDDSRITGAEQATNKDASGGYVGLTLFKHNLKNAAGTVVSFITTIATSARTYTFPDRDGTIADDTDLAGKQSTSGKDATGGYAGLTLFKINFKNAANTFTSFFTNSNTASRTYTFQDRDGTIADTTYVNDAIRYGKIYAQSVTIVASTATTSEEVLAFALIPGGTLQVGDRVEIRALFIPTVGGNSKTCKVKIHTASTVGGTAFSTTSNTSSSAVHIHNTGFAVTAASGTNAQIAFIPGGQSIMSGIISAGSQTANLAIASDIYIQFTTTKANAADTMSLYMYDIKILRP